MTEPMNERILRRISGIEKWLKESAPECFKEQFHLIEGTQARAYWHYGYMMALKDMTRTGEVIRTACCELAPESPCGDCPKRRQ